MRGITIALVFAAALTACSKTSEGDLEVQKPVVGTQTDTVNLPKLPDVDVKMDSATVAVPNVDVKRDSVKVAVPKVEVKKKP